MNYSVFPEWLRRSFPMQAQHSRAVVGGASRVVRRDRRSFIERHGGVLFCIIEDTVAASRLFRDAFDKFKFAGRSVRTVRRNLKVYLELPGFNPAMVTQDIETAFEPVPAHEHPRIPKGVRTVVIVADGQPDALQTKEQYLEYQKRFAGIRRVIILFASGKEVPAWIREGEKELASAGISWFECNQPLRAGDEREENGDAEEV